MVEILERASDAGKFGGKAANLARLLNAGLPVPPGFAVSVDAFDKTGGLKQEFQKQAAELTDKNKLYAVRSSALAEDAADASWAGQFESFLNVEAEEVVEMVNRCHGSAKERAVAYAKEKGASQSSFDVAVVVQQVIAPDYAGVLFTVDPVSGEEQIVIEYVEGLGEQLVSGEVTPELITWKDGPAPGAPFNAQVLIELAQKAVKVFGGPQDIEWASAAGDIFLLQARPITSL